MRIKHFTIHLCLLFILLMESAFAQQTKTIGQSNLRSIENFNTTNELQLLKSQLKGDKNHVEFKSLDTRKSDIKTTVTRYQQLYHNIPVAYAEPRIISVNGKAKTISGKMYEIKDLSIAPNIFKADALENALSKLNLRSYLWDLDDKSAYLENYEKPKGELVILPYDIAKDGQFHLCYKYLIYAIEPLYVAEVFVDAHNGDIVFENSLIHGGNVDANGLSYYNDTVDFFASTYLTNSGFELSSDTLSVTIKTFDFQGGTQYASNVTSPTTTFNHKEGVQTQWAMEKVYNYYKNVHGRDSYDDNGAQLRSFVNYGSNNSANNAFWIINRAQFGAGDGITYNPFVTLDVIAHEFTHGVIQQSANLIYQNQSGALNESFADIFGEMVEYYATGQNDWSIGQGIKINNTTLRSMSNPNSTNMPDTYWGQYFHTSSADYGGVHYNSAIQNYWFFLLSEGRNGINDFGDTFGVDGITKEKAAAIAYRNLTVYLTPNSNFFDAREGSIQAARDLFGVGSNEERSTTNAWYAVGIGKAYGDNTPYPDCIDNPASLAINTDDFPEDFAYFIKNSANNPLLFRPFTFLTNPAVNINASPNSFVTDNLPTMIPGNYYLSVGDLGLNGICCSDSVGSFWITDGNTNVARDSVFEYKISKQFCVGFAAGKEFDLVKPTPPTVSAVALNPFEIEVKMTGSTDNNAVQGHVLAYDTRTIKSVYGDSIHVLQNLEPNKTYRIQAFAFDYESTTSDGSNVVYVTTPDTASNVNINRCGENDIEFTLNFGANPSETKWEIKDPQYNFVASSGISDYPNSLANSSVTETISNIPDGDYYLVVYDRNGNGMQNGNFELSDSIGVFRNGGNFLHSDVQTFCVGQSNNSFMDTIPPTAPAISLSNPKANSYDITITPSTDNVGVWLYGFYINDSLVGSPSWNIPTNFTLNGQPNTQYKVQLIARDRAGNFSAFSNADTITTLGNTLSINSGYFETGWDNWIDGGNKCNRANNANKAPEGQFSIRLRRGNGNASSMFLENLDLSIFNNIDVAFQYNARGYELNEGFIFEIDNGNGWNAVKTYLRGTDFPGNGLYADTIKIAQSAFAFSTNSRIRFRNIGNQNNDRVFIDAIEIDGYTNSAVALGSYTNADAFSNAIDLFSLSNAIKTTDNASNNSNLFIDDIAQIEVYPNPTTSKFRIEGIDRNTIKNVQVYNNNGALLIIYAPNIEYDLSELKNGIKLIVVELIDGNQITKRIMKM